MDHKMTPLFTREALAQRVKELGQQITEDYKGETIIAIGVLKGSIIFLADLIREIKTPVEVEFIGISSYVGTKSTGEVRITHDLSREIHDCHVLVIEDIVDTGNTLDYLIDTLSVRKPKSLKIASLLSKPEAHQMEHHLDYIGFEISREFVVGYGLDLDGRYRELPEIMQIKD